MQLQNKWGIPLNGLHAIYNKQQTHESRTIGTAEVVRPELGCCSRETQISFPCKRQFTYITTYNLKDNDDPLLCAFVNYYFVTKLF